jgi:hypothetical protein
MSLDALSVTHFSSSRPNASGRFKYFSLTTRHDLALLFQWFRGDVGCG